MIQIGNKLLSQGFFVMAAPENKQIWKSVWRRPYKAYASKFEAELSTVDGQAVYDEEFFSRLSAEAKQLDKKSDRFLGLMIVLDVLLVLFASGQRFELKLLTVQIGVFPGAAEILVILSAVVYLVAAIGVVSLEVYKELLRGYVKVLRPTLNPEFYLSSRIENLLGTEVLIGFGTDFAKPGITKLVWQVITVIQLLVIILAFFIFHFLAAYVGLEHVNDIKTFGPAVVNWITYAVWITNIAALSFYLLTYVIPARYRIPINDNGEED